MNRETDALTAAHRIVTNAPGPHKEVDVQLVASYLVDTFPCPIGPEDDNTPGLDEGWDEE